MEKYPKNNLLGLPISIVSKSDLLIEINYRINFNVKTLIYGLCVGSLSRLKNTKHKLPSLLNEFDFIVPDGSAIPILGKIFGVPVKETIPITELSLECINLANSNKLTVFLFGATKEMNQLAIKKLREKFPNAIIPDGISGYYNKNEESKIVNHINSCKPDILLIGMSYPLKEEFAVKYKNKLTSSIIIPCGGAIDVFAGKTKRPPKIIKNLMLTWLYRWVQEPKRLKIASDLRFLFFTFPILLYKHFIGNEKNPSLIKHYKHRK